MQQKWYGLEELSYVAWSTCYAVFTKGITQFTLTGNFTWTSCGGTNFCQIGMVWAFGCSLVYCRRQTSRWLLMQLDRLVMEHTSRALGLPVPGLLLSNSSPLLTRSSSQLSSQPMFGGTCGVRGTYYSVQTTMLLKYLAWCDYCAACFSQPLIIVFLFLCNMYLALTIR